MIHGQDKAALSLSEKQKYAYFNHLINKTFKILPLKEEALKINDSSSYIAYLKGYEAEMIGFEALSSLTIENPAIIDVLSVVRYLIDNDNVIDKENCKNKVFKSIKTLGKIRDKYKGG